MSWANRSRITMEPDSRPLPLHMLEPVMVKVLRSFVLDDVEGKAGETITVPNFQASYLKFRGFIA